MDRTASFNVNFNSNESTTNDVSEFVPTFRQASIGGGSNIDDAHTLTTSTWSSRKIANELDVVRGEMPTAVSTADVMEIITGYRAP